MFEQAPTFTLSLYTETRTTLPAIDIYNELELLQRTAAGDQSAYKILYDRYWDQIFANALHFTKQPELAKDLTQEIFLKLWLMRDKLAQVHRFDSFLFTVAKNLIVDELRRLHTSSQYDEFFDAYFEQGDNPASVTAELKELESTLLKAIDQLPRQMQTAFKLSRFEGLSHEQVARRMNISRITSQNYIARAIVSIKKHLHSQQIELGILLCMLLS